MSKTINKLVAVLLAVLMLFLCSCGNGETEAVSSGESTKEAVTTSGEKVESSIFGRSVSYNAVTPVSDAALTVDSSDIINMIQMGKVIYFLTDGAVYTLDIESGEQGKLFDTDASMFATDGEKLYTYSPELGGLYVYSASGEIVGEWILELETDELRVDDLFVTDSYYVFVCTDSSGSGTAAQYNWFDRETLEKADTLSEKASMTPAQKGFCAYKGDSILKIQEGSTDSRYADIYEIDLVNAKTTKLNSVLVQVTNNYYAYTYNPKTDTILFLTSPRELSSSASLCLYEFSLSDPDNIALNRYYSDGDALGDKLFVSVYENVVSAVASCDNNYRSFDYLNQPEYVTLALNVASNYDCVISYFEKETGILVRTVDYGTDLTRLDIKLMAGDTDFDLYIPIFYQQNKYITAGMFEDLSQYESLKSRLDSDLAASTFSSLGDKYVGVPAYIYSVYNKDNYPENGTSGSYSLIISRMIYYARNIDIVNGVYNDPDGSELYTLFKYIYDNPTGNESKMPFGSDFNDLYGSFVIMNPNSQNKENSVKFLECWFDVMNGDVEGVIPESEQYVDIDSTDGYYVIWQIYSSDYVKPIETAIQQLASCDGKNSTIKELARETASEVRMRLME